MMASAAKAGATLIPQVEFLTVSFHLCLWQSNVTIGYIQSYAIWTFDIAGTYIHRSSASARARGCLDVHMHCS